jgi:hypothetical protein
MVGRLPDNGRKDRTPSRIRNSRVRCGSESQASSQASCGETPSAQSGKDKADGIDNVRGFCRAFFCAKCAACTQTLNAETVPLNPQLSPYPRIWSQKPLRRLHPGPAIVRLAKDGSRFRMGGLQSSPQSHVEDLCFGEEMGTLLSGKIRPVAWTYRRESRSTRSRRSPRSNANVCWPRFRSPFERWCWSAFLPVCASGRSSACVGRMWTLRIEQSASGKRPIEAR